MGGQLPLLILAPAGGLALNILLQAVLSRAARGDAHLRNQFFALGVGAVAAAAALAWLLARQPFGIFDTIGYLFLHLSIYLFFAFCFFNVINANVSSLRVRMLREYLACAPEPLPDREIYRRYPVRDMLTSRLARLESGRQIRAAGGRYFMGARFVALVGRFFHGLQRLLLPD